MRAGGRGALVATAAAAWVLSLAPAALAAPPTISGADGDRWNTTPAYVVTGGAGGYLWGWASSEGLEDATSSSPFTVTLPGLAEGEHQLVVWQANRPLSRFPRREPAVRTFVIDTTPPAAPALSGPPVIDQGDVLDVGWAGGEPGATFTWSVVAGAAGVPSTLVQGPVDTTAPGAAIAGLPAGAFQVLVTQRDAAGNLSPVAVLPVAVTPSATAALGVPAGPAASPPASLPGTVVRLPARNPARLKPRRAATLRILRPVLRWTPGPRDTSLYNVQLFRVQNRSPGATADAVTLRKVRSVFPRTNRFRTPRLARGACYVWRVWPYRTGTFTRQPIGVSHFCISRRPPARV